MLKPLEDRIVIKVNQKEEKSTSGIILKTDSDDDVKYGEIIEIGLGTEKETIEVRRGDKVIVSKHAGTEIKYKGEEFLIVNQKDVLAIIE